MARLSEEKISEIRRLYSEIGIYSQVAKITGCSPSTVKKYCTAPIEQTDIKLEFNKTIPKISDIDFSLFLENKDSFTTLSHLEKNLMKELWDNI